MDITKDYDLLLEVTDTFNDTILFYFCQLDNNKSNILLHVFYKNENEVLFTGFLNIKQYYNYIEACNNIVICNNNGEIEYDNNLLLFLGRGGFRDFRAYLKINSIKPFQIAFTLDDWDKFYDYNVKYLSYLLNNEK